MKTPLEYYTKDYHSLSLNQLYEILALRQKVFIIEQTCTYLDADGKDKEAYHVMGCNDNKLYAYARVLPKGISYRDHVSIGRVIIAPEHRGNGEGYTIMKRSLEVCRQLWPNESIKISAQSHLEKFYEHLGFQSTGDSYLEDGIPHVAMVAPAQVLEGLEPA